MKKGCNPALALHLPQKWEQIQVQVQVPWCSRMLLFLRQWMFGDGDGDGDGAEKQTTPLPLGDCDLGEGRNLKDL